MDRWFCEPTPAISPRLASPQRPIGNCLEAHLGDTRGGRPASCRHVICCLLLDALTRFVVPLHVLCLGAIGFGLGRILGLREYWSSKGYGESQSDRGQEYLHQFAPLMGPGGLGFLTPSWRKNMARRRICLGCTGRRSFSLRLPHAFANPASSPRQTGRSSEHVALTAVTAIKARGRQIREPAR